MMIQEHTSRRRQIDLLYVVLVAVGLASGVSLVVLWATNPAPGSLPFEAAKQLMQILGIVVLGTFVSLLSSKYQAQRESAAKALADRSEAEAKELEFSRRQWEQEVNRAVDARKRRDDVVRSILQQTIAGYHSVKRARRLLRARLFKDVDGKVIDVAVYDEFLEVINDTQLNFEQLKRLAPEVEGNQSTSSIVSRFSGIEKELHSICREYESVRRVIAHDPAGAVIASVPVLATFLEWRSPIFAPLYEGVGDVIILLRTELAKPIELPAPPVKPWQE